MVLAGASTEKLRSLLLPMTKVAAIVSPKARPKASIVPPTIPEKAAGIKTLKIVCQRVEPTA